MDLSWLSDRLRASPTTGEVVSRDLPTGDTARSLERSFSERRAVTSPQGGVASFQMLVSGDQPTDGAEIALQLGRFALNGAELGQPAVFYEWPCQLDDEEWSYDALVPLEVYHAAPAQTREGSLGKRSHHTFWIDVPVPRDARPGVYGARVGVEGGPHLDVQVEVVSVQLPLVERLSDLEVAVTIWRVPPDKPGVSDIVLAGSSYTGQFSGWGKVQVEPPEAMRRAFGGEATSVWSEDYGWCSVFVPLKDSLDDTIGVLELGAAMKRGSDVMI